ncbi:MAG: lytic transglycosylase domain-containing protein [Clostridia bacterium]|nr:lytic transglycosylase domain-containing protein [Clostridia bacterium]
MKINVRNYTKYLFYLVLVVCIIFIFLFNFYFYPLKYKNEIIQYSSKYSVDSALVASIICSESSFNANSQSEKGAIGLMQLMPSTAQWLCETLDEQFEPKKLFEPDFNIMLGTYYVSYLANKFNDLDLAIVAYNAGEGNVLKWLSVKEYSNDGKKLNYIPYAESENYLSKVKRAYNIYKDRI